MLVWKLWIITSQWDGETINGLGLVFMLLLFLFCGPRVQLVQESVHIVSSGFCFIHWWGFGSTVSGDWSEPTADSATIFTGIEMPRLSHVGVPDVERAISMAVHFLSQKTYE